MMKIRGKKDLKWLFALNVGSEIAIRIISVLIVARN